MLLFIQIDYELQPQLNHPSTLFTHIVIKSSSTSKNICSFLSSKLHIALKFNNKNSLLISVPSHPVQLSSKNLK
jgi:hypothetical protein